MNKEDKVRALMMECIQHLQQHPSLHRETFKSYLSAVYGESLKKCGMTVDQVCSEWDRRSRTRTPAAADHRCSGSLTDRHEEEIWRMSSESVWNKRTEG